MQSTVIIAEAGVNHNGDIELAKKLVDAASAAGVDYVKFQTFKAKNLVSKAAKKALYQQANTTGSGSQYDMLKKLELSEKEHMILIEHCHSRNVEFLSTAFDLESLALLQRLGITLFKVPSGEITNYQLLRGIGTTKQKVVLSTGMCTMDEIRAAIEVLTKYGTSVNDLTVLHCNTEYPTPMQDVNLLAMNTIKNEFKVQIGYSDHTLGIEVPIAAVALGAVLIEKHFTLDKTMEGPDHKASLEPFELKAMVTAIRNIDAALGAATKAPSASEEKNRVVARKSIHLAGDVMRGHQLTEADLAMKRPGDGISPMQMNQIIGKTMTQDLPEDAKLTWRDFS